MAELDAGVTLTPEENTFFENRGETPPPVDNKPAEMAEKPVADEGKDKVSGKDAEGEKAEKVVPLAALHEERRERQARDKQIAEMREQLARYDERFKLVEERAKPQAPSVKEDPFAYLEQIPNELDGLKQKISGYEQEKQQQAQQQQVISAYAGDVERFKAETKDFDAAYKFLTEGRLAELRAIGHPNPGAALHADEFGIVLQSLQSGRSPAETIYAVAKARGYAPKAADDNDAAKKLDTIQKGQAANKSLSSAGGTSGGEEMTADALLKMPMDEFETWVNKNPAKAKRLMGG